MQKKQHGLSWFQVSKYVMCMSCLPKHLLDEFLVGEWNMRGMCVFLNTSRSTNSENVTHRLSPLWIWVDIYRSCDLKLRSCTWGIDPHPIFGPKSIRKSCEVCQYRRIILIQSIGNTNTYKHQFDGTCRCAPNSITFSSQGSPFNVLRIPPNSPPFPPSIPLSTHRGTLTMVSSVVPIKPSAVKACSTSTTQFVMKTSGPPPRNSRRAVVPSAPSGPMPAAEAPAGSTKLAMLALPKLSLRQWLEEDRQV